MSDDIAPWILAPVEFIVHAPSGMVPRAIADMVTHETRVYVGAWQCADDHVMIGAATDRGGAVKVWRALVKLCGEEHMVAEVRRWLWRPMGGEQHE